MSIQRPHVTLASFAVVMILVAGVLILWPSNESSAIRIPVPASSGEISPKPAPLEFKPLTESEAVTTNAGIPFAAGPFETARAFTFETAAFEPFAQRTAVDCLTAAIYYEAGYEPMQGKRAVAQTVLNRVRHPAFPASICGVVYQGSERTTGCQFTFTCDGSLARKPSRSAWAEARGIAEAALNGFVEPSVGMATHYHANYVVPYWASSLDKISAVGAHLFYRWRGSWGRRAAFTQTPQPDLEAQVSTTLPMIDYVFDGNAFATAPVVVPESPILADKAPKLATFPPAQSPAGASARLHADDHASTLKADEAMPLLRESRVAAPSPASPIE